MADENKNQDPEEENKGASNDDDFGLPDFEFEALDDDDDDEVEESADNDATPEPPAEAPGAETESDDELPSIDDGDLEDLDLDLDDVDLEGIEDVDLDDLDDLGDLDLDDLDLEDLDKDIEDLDKTLEETEAPQPASADKVEDVFDEPRPEPKEEDVESIEDDGEFYEEESFGDFDDADFSEDSDLVGDMPESDEDDSSSDEEMTADLDGLEDQLEEIGEPGELPSGDYSDDFDSSIFDDETEGLDLGSGSGEPVPFAKRDLPDYGSGDEDEVDEISQEEIGESKGKFVRIVALGTVLFLAIGFGFLYWYSDGNLGQYFGGEPSEEVAEKEEVSKPVAKKTDRPAAKKETSQPAESKKQDDKSTSEAKKATSTPKTEQPKKEQPKKQEPKKTTTTKPASTSSTGGVSTLGATTGQRHIIVGSFLDEASAQAFAGKLAKQGENPSVIPPFNGAPNYRVSVASFASFSEANSNLESFRERFSGAWILRY